MIQIVKKILLFSLLVAAGVIYSCKSDNDEPDIAGNGPEITVTSSLNGTELDGLIEAHPGDQLTFDIEITSPAGFSAYRLYTIIDDGEPSVQLEILWEDLGLDDNAEAVSDTRNYEIPQGLVGNTVTFEFEAEDQVGQTSTTSVSLQVISRIATRTAVTLYPPAEDGSSEAYYSTERGMSYTMDEISSDDLFGEIDFGYTYSVADGITISDPVNFPGTDSWEVQNYTTFRRTFMDAVAFNGVITFSDIDMAYDAAEAADGDPGTESDLQVGEVLAFETDATKDTGSKRGLILIKSYVEGAEGHLELEVVVQKEVE